MIIRYTVGKFALEKEMIICHMSMVKAGEPNVIKKVGGKSETKKFLENLGFVVGGLVTVISEIMAVSL